ncbi:LuxR C-terminal-related transcriptional regulator [Ktedonobacter robiniae]|uniref:Helix-turn-helix transcriptional regulator n=1 Tax=Ktedonobacter robiniae TaxID=2778365 RepID=A0ABQ3UT89_9CHLR|nr:LuxR C-terminal-related transcriptional regulator [Ktedonobacter robiniae]GHO55882.1 helix-turn-helix transcriptional regulator [Ktedonobacter robiniae]
MSGDVLPLLPVLRPKLHLPRLRASMVPREELLARLDAASEHTLTLVSAPAGYGKTTLAAAWASRRNTCQSAPVVSWFALDESDNDPVRFWRYFIMACQVLHPGVGQAALSLLQSPRQPPPERLPELMLAALFNDLSHCQGVGVVVLEDYHLITSPQLHASLVRLLDLPSSALRLVILTRNDPPLPLARLRAHDDLYELRATDLRFSLEETRLFLGRALARPLAYEVVQHLAERTEGWPVGIQLAALALRGHENAPEAEELLSTFSGSHRHILEYLVEETLRAQPEELQTFLLQTSLLDRLTASLCDAVTGRNDSTLVLDQLERANLFLQPLDGAQAWYRYHALLAEAMRHEARRRLGESEIHALMSRASAWYEHEDMLPEAIEVAMQIQDFTRMTLLIMRLVEPLGNYFEHQTLWRWLRVLPMEILHEQPGLGFLYAAALLFTQDRHAPVTRTRIETPLRLAEHYWRAEGNLQRLAQIQSFRALVALWQEDYVESFRAARESLLHLPEHEVQWRGMSLLNVGLEETLKGRLIEAGRLFAQARQLLASCDSTAPMLAAISGQGDICVLQGKLHQASMFYQQVLKEIEERVTEGYWLDDKGFALLRLGRLSYEWNELEQAERKAHEALAIAEQRDLEELQIRALLLLALATLARGEHADYEEAEREAATRLARFQRPRLQRELLLEQANLALVSGDQPTARRWAANLPRDDEDFTYLIREREGIALARLLIEQGRTPEALRMLEPWLTEAHEGGRAYNELEILALSALAHATGSDQEQTMSQSRRLLLLALEKAQPEGYQRLFLNKGEPMRTLLRATLRDIHEESLLAYARKLIQGFSVPDSDPGIPDLLSPQELRVLRLLAAGRSRPEIARELVVSINTVKTQVKSIYRKLNVSTRKDAYDTAQRLGLL